jgi:putative dehydrogenase
MNTENHTVAVIGLGSMGMGAARSCIKAGLNTYGADINHDTLQTLKESGAKGVSKDCIDFAHELDSILLLVVNAKQVKKILFEDNLADNLRPDTAVMISATISADDARQIEVQLKNRNLIMLDAPVSGGAAKAEKGEMTIMASGSDQAFDKLKPVLDATGDKVYRIGSEIGMGATVKIIHQLLAGIHIAAGAEAMAMAAKSNIPLDLMYEVVTNAAGNSWMFENRMKHVVDGDYAPKSMVDIFVKDLGLVTDTAQSINFPLHLGSTAFQMFTSASNAGHGLEDDSAVIKIFKGIDLPEKAE